LSTVFSEQKSILISQFLLVVFVFFIPISPTVKSILFGVTVFSLLAMPYFREKIIKNYKTLWGVCGVLLFVYILISCLWSPAPWSSQMTVMNKYCKLLYLPILSVGFMNPKTRLWTLNAYLAAMVVTCICSLLKSKGLILTGDPGEVFYNHIITGFMVAFGSFIAVLLTIKSQGWAKVVYGLIAVFTSYQVLFINTGRTGYILYAVLMMLVLFNNLSIRRAMIGGVLFSITFVIAYTFSNTMHSGVDSLASDVIQYRHHELNTSLGYRIQFHDYAKSLFLEHPIAGIGTGGFKYRFHQDNPIPSWGDELKDPHSQYWLTLSEQGLIGFILFMCFLGSIYVISYQLYEYKSLLLGMLAAFCLGCMTDTILCYSTAGYLLVVITALCFGEFLERGLATTVKGDAYSCHKS
jgi:O-antigen ligase